MYRDFGVPQEIEQGLIQLLFTTAFPSDHRSPFTVITRDIALWVSNYPQFPMTLLDISPVFQPDRAPMAVGGSQLEREVKRQLLLSGWPATQIVEQNKRFPDFELLDGSGKLTAVLEVKGQQNLENLLGQPLAQIIRAAKELGARFALVTNGRRVLIYDSQSDMTLSRETLPTPAEIGLDVKPLDVTEFSEDEGPVSVVTVIKESEIAEQLRNLRTETLIFDHTIPWGHKPTDLPTTFFSLGTSEQTINSVVGVCTQSLCFSPNHSDIRKKLTSAFGIAGIVELPSDVLKPLVQIKSSIVALSRLRNATREKTYFLSISSRDELLDSSSRPWFANLKKGLSGKESATGFRVLVTPEEAWTVAAHDPGKKRMQAELSKYPTVNLGDTCEIYLGFKHSRDEVLGGKGTPVVRGRDISRAVDSKEELTHYRTPSAPPEHAKIAAGDVLVQRIGLFPACMVAPPTLSGAIASDTVIIIRPKDQELSSQVISQFFSSNIGQHVLSSIAVGTYAPTLSLAALRKLQVPLLPREIYDGLDELSDIEQALRTKADKLRSLRSDLFGSDSQLNVERRMQELRQTAKAVSSSVQQAETLDFQIRNFYPYPLAFTYRSLSANTVFSDLYREQLRLAENIVAFVASVSLALISVQDRTACDLDLKEYWQRGISPGHWREIAHKCSGTLSEYKTNRLAQALNALWKDRRNRVFQERIDQLISAKNDFKHDRGPKTEEDFELVTRKTQAMLEDCMHDLGFFAQHPLRLIRDMTGIRGRRDVSLITLMCMSDHPGFTQQQTTYPNLVIKNELYIEVDKDSWMALHPFLVPYNCSQCNNREFYFIDRWMGKGKFATLKSFERGHTHESQAVGEELGNW